MAGLLPEGAGRGYILRQFGIPVRPIITFRESTAIPPLPSPSTTYVNEENWKVTYINNGLLEFPAIITNTNVNKRVKLTFNESKINEIDEQYGREPYTFTIEFMIGESNLGVFREKKRLINELYRNFYTYIDIINPDLKELGITKMVLIGLSMPKETREQVEMSFYELRGSMTCREHVINVFERPQYTEDQQTGIDTNRNLGDYTTQAQSNLALMNAV